MPAPAPIDYSPLDKMRHSDVHVFKTAFHGFSIPIFIVLAALCIGGAITPIRQFSFLIIFAYGAVMMGKINAYKNNIWKEFAALNGWQVVNKATVSELPQSVNYGHNRNYGTVIKAKFEAVSCDIFVYDTTTGQGKYQVTHYFTIATVPLNASVSLPHIILNSKKEKADIQQKFPDYEKLKLEGDFNDYFTLIVEKGAEVDVLTVLTPDVMQTLINSDTDEDIEIDGQMLYFILRSDKRDPESMKKLIDSVTALIGQIGENLKLRSAASSQTTAPATTTTAPIAGA
jgi:hypothetical protein